VYTYYFIYINSYFIFSFLKECHWAIESERDMSDAKNLKIKVSLSRWCYFVITSNASSLQFSVWVCVCVSGCLEFFSSPFENSFCIFFASKIFFLLVLLFCFTIDWHAKRYLHWMSFVYVSYLKLTSVARHSLLCVFKQERKRAFRPKRDKIIELDVKGNVQLNHLLIVEWCLLLNVAILCQ
jgi:hypothetical protein